MKIGDGKSRAIAVLVAGNDVHDGIQHDLEVDALSDCAHSRACYRTAGLYRTAGRHSIEGDQLPSRRAGTAGE